VRVLEAKGSRGVTGQEETSQADLEGDG
jgi:hypothetical protein